MSLLIHDATVITVDPARRVLQPGAVYVEGSRIADAGPSGDGYRSFGLKPTLDPVQNLVYHAHARDVEMVPVDGDRRGGWRAATVDAAALVDRAQEAAVAAWERFVDKYGGHLAA